MIFEELAAMDMRTHGHPFHDTSTLPWMLMRICWGWREIVQHMPSLWTRVHVSADILGASGHHPDDIALALTTYLKYSNPLPITLVILCEGAFPTYILPPLIETCDRWRSLLLFAHPDDLHRLDNIRGRLPALQSLHIVPTHEDSPPSPIPAMFELAPALMKAILGGSALNLYFTLPWAKICDFEANLVASGEVLPLLPLMPALHRLKLGLEPPTTMSVDARAWPVTHTGIRYAHVERHWRTYIRERHPRQPDTARAEGPRCGMPRRRAYQQHPRAACALGVRARRADPRAQVRLHRGAGELVGTDAAAA